jgi:hypothetical protein
MKRYEIEVSASMRFVLEAQNRPEAVEVARDRFNGTPARCLDITVTVLPDTRPRCTCKDTYEVGSGDRCPVHEVDA